MDKNKLGLIHIYTGNGKGKTTAAMGLILRASGRGLKVILGQFLKDRETGELTTLKLLPGVQVFRGKSCLLYTSLWQIRFIPGFVLRWKRLCATRFSAPAPCGMKV